MQDFQELQLLKNVKRASVESCFQSVATDSQLDLDLDWGILTREYIFI